MQGADERLFPSFTASGENSTLLTGYIQAKWFGNEIWLKGLSRIPYPPQLIIYSILHSCRPLLIPKLVKISIPEPKSLSLSSRLQKNLSNFNSRAYKNILLVRLRVKKKIKWSWLWRLDGAVNEHIIEFYLYCIRYTINILYYLTDLQQVRLKSEFLKIGNFGEI